MDIGRKIGIGIVLIVPAFVGSGALWSLFESWIVVLVWLALLAFGYRWLFTGKLEHL
jgi:FtsH-binding integral membrane protein